VLQKKKKKRRMIGGSCTINGVAENNKVLVIKPDKRRPFLNTRCTCVGNIICLKVGLGGMKQSNLAERGTSDGLRMWYGNCRIHTMWQLQPLPGFVCFTSIHCLHCTDAFPYLIVYFLLR
jgi:hypothetical protein